MQSYPECIPCVFKQVLNTVRLVTDDEEVQRALLLETAKVVQRADYSRAAAEISWHALIRAYNLLGCLDPYREAKLYYNNLMLESIDELRALIDAADDPLHTAVKMAVAGNIIDMGILGDAFDVHETVKHALETGLAVDHFDALKRQLDKARSVLYILDNAGEVVFDRLLIERLAGKQVCCVVRKSPILNDVTRVEAEEVGLNSLCEIADTGCDVFGVPMDLVSDAFRERFYAADIVISKGQANYETLDLVDRQVFFILMAKCDRVAQRLCVPLRHAVVMDSLRLPYRAACEERV
ncbi:MAG TPA: ARMT1-like domain-containing protein [Planctomycetota bacterium]|nr:ARMT1-like domain-containing protein [Planctomycetota bacterium]